MATPEHDKVQAFAAFLPAFVVRGIADGVPLPLAPEATCVEAATLVTDVTGYTSLTESATMQGARGPERVAAILDASFSLIIDTIQANGGDILAFAGDAIIAAWPVRPTAPSLAANVRVAARCGQAIQDQLEREFSRLQVRTRLGVGVGQLQLARVSTAEGTGLPLATGDALHETSLAAKSAEPGGVRLTERARVLCEEPGDAAPPRVEAVEPSELTLAALATYLPPSLLARLDAGPAQWISELRELSVVFVILRHIPTHTAAGRAKLRRAIEAVSRIAGQMQGEVNSILQDDSGQVLVCAFGLPTCKHDDDPERASLSALRVEEDLFQLGVTYGVGVTTGLAFCGPYGSTRKHYAIIGDSVNVAARLAQNAENQILCDKTTATRASGRVRFKDHGAISVKGKAGRLSVFAPVASHSAQTFPRRTVAIVGRVHEIGLITAATSLALAGGAPPPIVIQGEAGIGKSSLVHAALGGVPGVLFGSGNLFEGTVAFHAWRDPLAQLIGLHDAEGSGARIERVQRRVRHLPGMENWAPLLGTVLSLPIAENEITARMSGSVRGEALLSLVVELMRQACLASPRVIVIDDAHWLDASSRTLVARMQGKVPGLLLVLVGRLPESGGPDSALAWLPPSAVTVLTLGDLDAADAVAILARTLGVRDVSPEAAAFILSKGHGNPLFTRELAMSLRDDALLTVADQRCELNEAKLQFAATTVPTTLQGVILRRLDSLDARRLLLVKVASVIGGHFDVEMVREVHPVATTADETRRDLDALVELGFLQWSAVRGVAMCSFFHALVQDGAYSLLPFAQREQLHVRTALWLEAHPATDQRVHHALLARHWKLAHDLERALQHTEKAGELALAEGANREAAALFAEALASPRAQIERDRVAHWFGQLGDAQYALGDLDRSRAAVHQALTLLGEPMPQSGVGWLTRALAAATQQAQMLWRQGPAAQAGAPQLARWRRAAKLAAILGEQYYFSMQLGRMLTTELVSVNFAERAGAPDVACRSYGALGYLVGLMRMHGLAERYFRRARAGTEARALANAQVAEALYHLAFARWDACTSAVNEGLALTRSVGDKFSQSLLLNVRADAEHWAVGADVAAASYEELLRLAREAGNTQHQVWALSGIAECALSLADFGSADAALATQHGLLTKADDLSLIRYWGIRALADLRAGRPAEALEAVDQFLARSARQPAPMYANMWAVLAATQAALELWQSRREDSLRRKFAATRRILRLYALLFPIARARQARVDGYMALIAGQPRKAGQCLQQSRALAGAYQLSVDARLAESGAAPAGQLPGWAMTAIPDAG